MNCLFCKDTYNLKGYKLCESCRFDNTITISYTNVKQKYGLDYSALHGSNLYYFTFKLPQYSGTKYLIDEIETFAEKYYAKIKDDDSNKKKFIKQKSKMSSIRAQRNQIIQRKHDILNNLKMSIKKYGLDDSFIDNYEMRQSIAEYIYNFEISPLLVSLKVIHDLEIFIIKCSNLENRKKQIHNYIEKNFIDKKYFNFVMKHHLVNKYIYDDNLDFNEVINQLDTEINIKKSVPTRRKLIDGILRKEKLLGKFNKKDCKIYQDYVSKNENHNKTIQEIVDAIKISNTNV